jgi:hypothetical protein
LRREARRLRLVGQGKQREVKAFYTASLHTFVSLSRFRNEGMSMMRMIRGFLDRCPIPTINAKHPLNYDFGII